MIALPFSPPIYLKVYKNKAIIFNVAAFQNNNYTYIQPAIIRTINGSVSALKLERTKRLTANGGKIDISYTGLEDASTVAVEDIVIDKVKYDTAKSIALILEKYYHSFDAVFQHRKY